MRINKYLVEAGIAVSRRKADAIIKSGNVKINKNIAIIGDQVEPDRDKVFYKGKLLKEFEKKHYLALYKPRGYICSHRKFKKTESILKLLPKGYSWKWAGRLDVESEGLIFVSNDGDWINLVTHPSKNIEKHYIVKTDIRLTKIQIKEMIDGVKADNEKLYAEKIFYSKNNLNIILKTGKKRQIRRMMKYFNVKVTRLIRIRQGKVKYDGVIIGGYKKLSKREVDFFKKIN